MSLWSSLFGWLSSDDASGELPSLNLSHDDGFSINPANGLPMVGGSGGVDVEGNLFGMDSHSSMDDSWSSPSSSDSFSSIVDSFSSSPG